MISFISTMTSTTKDDDNDEVRTSISGALHTSISGALLTFQTKTLKEISPYTIVL